MSLLLTARPRASGDTYLMARQHILWPAFATAATTTTLTASASAFWATSIVLPNTQHSYLEWADVALSPGDYRVSVLGYAATNYGTIHALHDGADTSARIDQNVTAAYNQLLSDTFTVAAKTRGPLRLAMSSKTGTTYFGEITQAAIIKTSAGDDAGESVDDLPWFIDVPLLARSSVSAGWALAMASSYYGGSTYYSDGTNGRWVEWQVWLPAGTWSLSAIHYAQSAQGILDLSLDGGASSGTIDCYSAGTVTNNKSTISGISVPTTKIYSVRLTVNGKNASSGGHAAYIMALQFRRTA